MRNLKKFLALVLAMMMVMGLMVTANAAKLSDFSDKDDVDKKYASAIDVLTQLDILKGRDNGLQPKEKVQRSEVSTLVYRVMTGDVQDEYVGDWLILDWFDDQDEAEWAIGYINYAANAGIVYGYGDKFYPTQNVTGYQMLAMMLRTLGYGKNGEYQGDNWEREVFSDAAQLGLVQGVTVSLGEEINREVVAQILYNAMNTELVKWNSLRGYEGQDKKLVGRTPSPDYDEWGRPSTNYVATFNKMETGIPVTGKYTVYNDLVAKFAVAMDECDIVADKEHFNVGNGAIKGYWVDGEEQNVTDKTKADYTYVFENPRTGVKHNDIDALHVGYTTGGQGVITEIYKVAGGYHVVQIHTWLAKVTGVTESVTDKGGHPTQRTIELTVYAGLVDGAKNGETNDKTDNVKIFKTVEDDDTGYVKGNYVLVHINLPVDNYDNLTNLTYTNEKVEAAIKDRVKNLEDKTYEPDEIVDGYDEDDGFLEIVGDAPEIMTGELKDWSNRNGENPATTTLDKTTTPDNVDFFLNWRYNGSWTAFGDGLDKWGEKDENGGNIIGLAKKDVPDDYLVIKAMRWAHDNVTSVKDGTALADLILNDGTLVPAATIKNINGVPAVNSDGPMTLFSQWYNTANKNLSGVADNWANNGAYYGHIWRYAVNSDNTYDIWTVDNDISGDHAVAGGSHQGKGAVSSDSVIGGTHHVVAGKNTNIDDCTGNNIVDIGFDNVGAPKTKGVLVRGEANIFLATDYTTGYSSTVGWKSGVNGVSVKARGTDGTIYLIENAEKDTFDVVVGKSALPEETIGDICVAFDSEGFATLVVVTNVKDRDKVGDGSKFIAWVADIEDTDTNLSRPLDPTNTGTKKDYIGHEVYKLGETKVTYVYDGPTTANKWTATTVATTGLYEIEVDEYDIIQQIKLIVSDTKATVHTDGKTIIGKTDTFVTTNDYSFQNTMATAAVKENSMYGYEEGWTGTLDNPKAPTSGTAFEQDKWGFNVFDGYTTYIKVTKNYTGTVPTDADVEDLVLTDKSAVSEKSVIVVGYDPDNLLTPYVYIIEAAKKTAEETECTCGGDPSKCECEKPGDCTDPKCTVCNPPKPETTSKVNDVDLVSNKDATEIGSYDHAWEIKPYTSAGSLDLLDALSMIDKALSERYPGYTIESGQYTAGDKPFTDVSAGNYYWIVKTPSNMPVYHFTYDPADDVTNATAYVTAINGTTETKVLLTSGELASLSYQHIADRIGLTAKEAGTFVRVNGSNPTGISGTGPSDKDKIEFGYFEVAQSGLSNNTPGIIGSTKGTYTYAVKDADKLLANGGNYYVKATDTITIEVTLVSKTALTSGTDKIKMNVTSSSKYESTSVISVTKNATEGKVVGELKLQNFSGNVSASLTGNNYFTVNVVGVGSVDVPSGSATVSNLASLIDDVTKKTGDYAKRTTNATPAVTTYQATNAGTLTDGDTVEFGYWKVEKATVTTDADGVQLGSGGNKTTATYVFTVDDKNVGKDSDGNFYVKTTDTLTVTVKLNDDLAEGKKDLITVTSPSGYTLAPADGRIFSHDDEKGTTKTFTISKVTASITGSLIFTGDNLMTVKVGGVETNVPSASATRSGLATYLGLSAAETGKYVKIDAAATPVAVDGTALEAGKNYDFGYFKVEAPAAVTGDDGGAKYTATLSSGSETGKTELYVKANATVTMKVVVDTGSNAAADTATVTIGDAATIQSTGDLAPSSSNKAGIASANVTGSKVAIVTTGNNTAFGDSSFVEIVFKVTGVNAGGAATDPVVTMVKGAG